MYSIHEFRYPVDYDPVKQLWESMETGIHVGRFGALEEIAKKVSRDPDLFLMAEVNGKIIGSVLGGFDGRRGLIYHLAVAADHRKKGVGGGLLSEVESRLRSKGCLKCYLMVTPDNAGVGEFYENRGLHFMDYVLPYGKELL